MYFVDSVVFYCCEIFAEGSLLRKHLHGKHLQRGLLLQATWATLVDLAHKVGFPLRVVYEKYKQNCDRFA